MTLTERYLNSAVPQMQRMFNCYEEKRFKTLKQISMPVNLDLGKICFAEKIKSYLTY